MLVQIQIPWHSSQRTMDQNVRPTHGTVPTIGVTGARSASAFQVFFDFCIGLVHDHEEKYHNREDATVTAKIKNCFLLQVDAVRLRRREEA